jgi:hypothetical protein
MQMTRSRLAASSVVALLMLSPVACADGDSLVSPLEPGLAVSSDAPPIPVVEQCPPNLQGFTQCVRATPEDLALMRHHLNYFRTSGSECFAAGHVIQGVINDHEYTNGSVWIASDGNQGAMVSYMNTGTGGPYPIDYMIIRDYMMWPAYVHSGQFREMLYHEGGHATYGYPDGVGPGTANQFGLDCLEDEDIQGVPVEVTYGQGGWDYPDPGPAGLCLIMIDYWYPTMEVIGVDVVYCW